MTSAREHRQEQPEHAPRESRPPIYCCVPVEFSQPWEHLGRIRQIKELGLGNVAMLSTTFHVGNSDADRLKWKTLFPSLADEIDATPRFPGRPEHGMTRLLILPLESWLEEIRLCRELGLSVLAFIASSLPAKQRAAVRAAAQGLVLADEIMCESTSMLAHAYSLEKLRQIDALDAPNSVVQNVALSAPTKADTHAIHLFEDIESLDFQTMHDWFVNRFKCRAQRLRAEGAQLLCGIEAGTQMHLIMEAGGDLPIFELVPAEPRLGLAATRGAAKAYGAPFWGVHTAMGYYRAPTDRWTPERLQIAYNLWYAGGAGLFSEPNIAFHNWGSCSAFFTIPGSPAPRLGEKECRDFDDPICVRGREVLADHYRFTQFHDRPHVGPRVNLGFLIGHLDGYIGHDQSHVWMVDHPGFAAGPAEESWQHFGCMHDTESWYLPPRKNYWQADPAKPLRYGTPPCGQLDIVPIGAPQAQLQSYGCLVLLGWNSMTPDLYTKLRTYVENGGRLLLSVPHLDTRLRRDRPPAIIHDGDVRDLCGVRVLGQGARIEEVSLFEQSGHPAYVFPTGTLYQEDADVAELELCGARVLAHPRDSDTPVFLEHRCGQGFVYLLATWDYPGCQLDSFVTDILRVIADGEQDEIRLEGTEIEYAVYDGTMPSGQAFSTVYVVNKNIYGQPQIPWLHVRDERIPLRVDGYGMRIVWITDDLVVAPFDRFLKVTDATRAGDTFTLTLGAKPGPHRIQVAGIDCKPQQLTLNGRQRTPNLDSDGAVTLPCRSASGASLTIRI